MGYLEISSFRFWEVGIWENKSHLLVSLSDRLIRGVKQSGRMQESTVACHYSYWRCVWIHQEGKMHTGTDTHTCMHAQHQFFLTFLNKESIILSYSGPIVSGVVNMLPLYQGISPTKFLLFCMVGVFVACVKTREDLALSNNWLNLRR